MSLELSLLYKQCGKSTYMSPALHVTPKDGRPPYSFANIFEKRGSAELALVSTIYYYFTAVGLTKTLKEGSISSVITPWEKLAFLRSVKPLEYSNESHDYKIPASSIWFLSKGIVRSQHLFNSRETPLSKRIQAKLKNNLEFTAKSNSQN